MSFVMQLHVNYFLIVAAVVFIIGVAGVLIRRNALVIFMSVELMLNAVNLTFIAFAQKWGAVDGQIFVFFIMTVAAVEVAVGLALIISIFRIRSTVHVDEINLLHG